MARTVSTLIASAHVPGFARPLALGVGALLIFLGFSERGAIRAAAWVYLRFVRVEVRCG